MYNRKRKDFRKSDKLSNLPDEIIHKILSFIDIKEAIKTSILSSRWRFIWTSMPYLNFSNLGSYDNCRFIKFAKNVLSRRNNKIGVASLEFRHDNGYDMRDVFKRIMDYAISHSVQQMTITYNDGTEFPITFFSSRSLKHLTLIKCDIIRSKSPRLWELPALTMLDFHKVRLFMCDRLIVMCPNLRNLTLNKCIVEPETKVFSIINSGLVNLTLRKVHWDVGFVDVDTPQLKNLIFVDTTQREDQRPYNKRSIRDLSVELTISAPDLTHLLLKGSLFPKLSVAGFHSLEKADIRISYPHKTDVHNIYGLLQHLYNVKFLKLSLEIVELLSSSVEVISHQPSPFASLKSLKIYPAHVDERGEKKKINVSREVKNYLLDSSPKATFTMVSRKEIIAMRNVTSAKKHMAELRVLLEQAKADIKTNDKAHMEQRTTHIENKLQTQESVDQIYNCLDDLPVQIKQEMDKALPILDQLKHIKTLLRKLPRLERAVILPCFSRLCAEADVVTHKRISACFRELVASFEPSS